MQSTLRWKDVARWAFDTFVVSPVGYYRENYGGHGYNELIYQHLLLKELKKHGLEDNLTPVGGAASYSLLYHLLRSLVCLQPSQVLELGAGQSSLLLSACNGVVFDGNILTIEQDKGWASAISSRVSHEVRHVPVRTMKVGRSTIIKYDELKSHLGERKFELAIIDGPTGTKALSRSSILDHIENLSQERFVIIFDDTNRTGEKQAVRILDEELRKNFDHVIQFTVRSSRHQTIFLHNVNIHDLYLT